MNSSTTAPAQTINAVQPLTRYLDGQATQKDLAALNKHVFSQNPTQLQELLIDQGEGVLTALASATATIYMLTQAHKNGATFRVSKVMDCLEPLLSMLEVAENDFICALEGVGAIQYKARA